MAKTKTKGKFSTTQKFGVAAGVLVSPWFLPVALFPSIVRKTVAIATNATATAEIPKPAPPVKYLFAQRIAAGIMLGVIALIVIVLVVAPRTSRPPAAQKGGAPAAARAEAPRAPGPAFPEGTTIDWARAHYDGSPEQADWIVKHR